MAVGYLHINGSNGTNPTGAIDVAESEADGTSGFILGASRQRVLGAGANYTYGPAVIGLVYTRSVFQGTNAFDSANGAMSVSNYEVNAKYTVPPAFTLGVADTYTEGHVGNGRTFGTEPEFNQVNVQPIYAFSRPTDVYAEAMYQHAIGAPSVAFINATDGASSAANQVVGTIGIRTRF